MYRNSTPDQLSFEDFYLPFGGKLSSENRWVKLSKLIPWEEFEGEYAAQFSKGIGAPAKSFRMALGALIIKERLGITDEETVEQIRENPYLQFFLGLSEYSNEAAFDASMMVHFRKRLNLEIVGRVNEEVVKATEKGIETVNEEDEPPDPPTGGKIDPVNGEEKSDKDAPPNKGQLLLDASCAPADIRYPTDLSLLSSSKRTDGSHY